MSDAPMKKNSRTDWERVDAMTDQEIDTSDIPPLTDEFFKRARVRRPRRVPVTVSIDADVLDWFNAQGEERDHRINAALRIYAKVHKVAGRE